MRRVTLAAALAVGAALFAAPHAGAVPTGGTHITSATISCSVMSVRPVQAHGLPVADPRDGLPFAPAGTATHAGLQC